MIVITLSKVPQSLRGDLTKWCQEVQTGVYVGNFNARVRDLLWSRILKNIGSGEATLIYNTNNEIGYTFETTRKDKRVADYDGVPLIMSLNKSPVVRHGFSDASKFHKAKITKNRATIKNNIDIVSIDIETTGLNPISDEIISIGAVKQVNMKKSEFYQLVKCNNKIPKNIVELTNITNELIEANGLPIKEVLQEFKNFIGSYDLAGYNIAFDYSFLLSNFNKLHETMITNKTMDVMKLIKKKNKFLDNYRLQTVLKEYGIIDEYPHNALWDAKATLELINLLMKR